MTANRRIILNIVATYGRSLYALALGIFTTRWVLEALGQVDFGLYGVVGGLTAFIAFFNGVLAYSVGRFYALEIGRASVDRDSVHGLEQCRKWFSVAMAVHTIVPAVLMAVGYPVGEWVVRHYLVIPPDRAEACLWVFRISCAMSFLGMISVPFNAMYQAKQFIAELTVYSFVTTTLNAMFVLYMVLHPATWLVPFAFWTCLLSIAPQMIIIFRAFCLFPECRFRLRYCLEASSYRQLLAYTGWQTFGALGAMLRSQGLAILINRWFGASVNAAKSVASRVNAHSCALSESMLGAFMPAITSTYGAGDIARTRVLALRVCKLSVMLSLIFVIPLMLELQTILEIWLKTPPESTGELCLALVLSMVVDRTTIGHMVVVHATGRVALYQSLLGGALIATLPLAWLLYILGMGVHAVSFALVIAAAVCAWGRLYFTKRLLDMDVGDWWRKVMLPIIMLAVLAVGIGGVPVVLLNAGLVRVCVTTVVCEAAILPLAWFFVCDSEERAYVVAKVCKGLLRLKEGGAT